MKVAELYAQTAQLGFEKTLESDERFYQAANRALLQVNDLRPRKGSLLIHHRPLPNGVEGASFLTQDKAEQELVFQANAPRAYYFEADGVGEVLIEMLNAEGTWVQIGEEALSGNGSFLPYRGLIKADGENVSGAVRLRFTGEYLYTVRNVALYTILSGGSVEDIPAFEPYVTFDVSRLASDFLALPPSGFLEKEDGEAVSAGYRVEDGRRVLLPREDGGCFKVIYNRLPAALKDDGAASDDLNEIDLDADLAALMPELVAAYVLIEEESELAQYYLALYRTRAAEILAKGQATVPLRCINREEW